MSTIAAAAAAAAKSLQSCPPLCDPIDGSPPGSAIPGILRARALERLPLPSPAPLLAPDFQYIYLAASALHCGTQDLRGGAWTSLSGVWRALEHRLRDCCVGLLACSMRDLDLRPGIELR